VILLTILFLAFIETASSQKQALLIPNGGLLYIMCSLTIAVLNMLLIVSCPSLFVDRKELIEFSLFA